MISESGAGRWAGCQQGQTLTLALDDHVVGRKSASGTIGGWTAGHKGGGNQQLDPSYFKPSADGQMEHRTFTKSPRKRKRLRSDLQVAVRAEEGKTLARWLEQYERKHAELMCVIERYNRIVLCGGRLEIGRRHATGAHQDWVTATTLVTKINGGRDAVQMDEMKSRGDGGTEARLGHQCWVGQRAKRYWKTDRRILRGYTGGRISMNIGPQYSPAQAKTTVGDAMLPELQEWLDFYYEVRLRPSSVVVNFEAVHVNTLLLDKTLRLHDYLAPPMPNQSGVLVSPFSGFQVRTLYRTSSSLWHLRRRTGRAPLLEHRYPTLLGILIQYPLPCLRDHLVPPMLNQSGVLVFGISSQLYIGLVWTLLIIHRRSMNRLLKALQPMFDNICHPLQSPNLLPRRVLTVALPAAIARIRLALGESGPHRQMHQSLWRIAQPYAQRIGKKTHRGVWDNWWGNIACVFIAVALNVVGAAELEVNPVHFNVGQGGHKTRKNRVVGAVVGVHDAGNLRLVQPKVTLTLILTDTVHEIKHLNSKEIKKNGSEKGHTLWLKELVSEKLEGSHADECGDTVQARTLGQSRLRSIPNPHAVDPILCMVPQQNVKTPDSERRRSNYSGGTPWFPFWSRADFGVAEIVVKGGLES
ncbi:hypothetical protein DFH07DRAFT_776976 [Mycena maculata]|uniref:Uncharacterized protein n=1 Tax=Mycena maculata TaxID=230809 RepID=A0AAD7ILY4_9AGAR|nr:hypothetical protein DFH07DRAFT_776976 [Mycena maculata]